MSIKKTGRFTGGPVRGTYYRGVMSAEALLKPSSVGTFGAGLYFADRKCAEVYGDGGWVLEAEVTFAKPYRVFVRENDCQAERSGASLLVDVLGPARAKVILDQSDFGHFGDEIKDVLESRGFDGLIATYYDGSQEIIAYDKAQIAPSGLFAMMPGSDEMVSASAAMDTKHINWMNHFVGEHIRTDIALVDWATQFEQQARQHAYARAQVREESDKVKGGRHESEHERKQGNH